MRSSLLPGFLSLLALAAPAPSYSMAVPQTAGAASFDPMDPRYKTLYALQDAAEALQNASSGNTAKAAEIAEAWTKLRDAAARQALRPGVPHPLAAFAEVKLASVDYGEGRSQEAIARAKRGLEGLAPYKDDYMSTYAEGVSLLSLLLSQAGDQRQAAALLERGIADFTPWFDSIPPAERLRATAITKSNLEFALSQVLSRLGETEKAVDYQKRSLETRAAALGENDPDTIASYYGYANVLLRAEKRAEAERYARLAVEKAVANLPPEHVAYARALEMLGIVLSQSGRRMEGLDYLTRSIDVKRDTVGTGNLLFAYGVHNLGSVLLQLERYDDAEGLFLEAEKAFRTAQGEASPYGASALAYAGQARFARGDVSAAAERLGLALERLAATGEKDDQIRQKIYPDLILSQLALGRRAEAAALAERFLANGGARSQPFVNAFAAALAAYASGDPLAPAQRLVRLVTASQGLSSTGELSNDQRSALDLVLRIAAERQQPELGLEAMAVLAGSKIAQAGRLVADRLATADPKLSARVRELQERTRDVEAKDKALLAALAKGEGVADAQVSVAAAEALLAADRALLVADYPQWSEARAAERPTIAEVQRSLAKGQALVAIVPAYANVYVLTVTARGARLHRTHSGRGAVTALVDRVRASLAAGFDTAAAHALHQEIFTPESRRLLRGTNALRVVPAGIFSTLPPSLLLEAPADAPSADARWLFKRYALSVQPGFVPARNPGAVRRADRFLGVGAPLPFAPPADARPAEGGAPATRGLKAAHHYFRGGGAAAGALAELPPLPSAAGELEAVARSFGAGKSTLLVGREADEAVLKTRDLSNYSVILFSTHGLLSGEMDGVAEPALVLSPPAEPGADGLLTASEIAALRLSADWVILSACNTAAGGAGGSAAYSGLAQAFRFAGASSLLVSHWPVRDDVAAFLTVETVRASQRGMRKDQALQHAMRKLASSRTIADAAEPFAWAPFVLVSP